MLQKPQDTRMTKYDSEQCGSMRCPLQYQLGQIPQSQILMFSQEASIPVRKTSFVVDRQEESANNHKDKGPSSIAL